MIGVQTDGRYKRVVEELFELFKTPWEFARAGQEYDVVLVSGSARVISDARLIVRYDVESDKAFKASGGGGRHLRLKDRVLPIYGAAVSGDSKGRGDNNDHPVVLVTNNRDGEEREEIRVGYDLFAEVDYLLKVGQPPRNAQYPTLDWHIQTLREFIIEAGLPLIEIPPLPFGFGYIACLTHDIDFVSMRQHAVDRTMLGFLYRASVGSLKDVLSGRRSAEHLVQNWCSLFKVPFVLTGLADDFWLPFPKYLEVEKGKPATYFIIPFKDEPGRGLANGPADSLRATRYDAGDVGDWLKTLRESGCEVGLHGIDAWSDERCATEENERIGNFSGERPVGLRMHWLFFSPDSCAILDRAGFEYDSTCGYNEAVGYKAGTSQVFRPLNAERMLELPMHIQDTALFYPGRMHLAEATAWEHCQGILDHAKKAGGVVTLLWHDRSLVPERLWGDFYVRLLKSIESSKAWFASANQVVRWFGDRRKIHFLGEETESGEVAVQLEIPSESCREFSLRYSWANDEGVICSRDIPVKKSGSSRFKVLLAQGAGSKDGRSEPDLSALPA
jgi:hypothetical protein